MRSLILLILGVSVASAGGYYYRDDIPTRYRFWESVRIVELQHDILDQLKLPSVDVAVLETVSEKAPLPEAVVTLPVDVKPSSKQINEIEPLSEEQTVKVDQTSIPIVPDSSQISPAKTVVKLTQLDEVSFPALAQVTDSILPKAIDDTPIPPPTVQVPDPKPSTGTSPITTPVSVADAIAPATPTIELKKIDNTPVAKLVLSTDPMPPAKAEIEQAKSSATSTTTRVIDTKAETPEDDVIELAKNKVTSVSESPFIAKDKENVELDASLLAELGEELERDARVYVNDLSDRKENNVAVKEADHFVSADQVLELLADDTFVELLAPLSSKPIIQALAPRSRSERTKLGADFDTVAPKELVLIQTTSSEDLRPLIADQLDAQNIDDPVMIVRQASAVLPVLPELERSKQKQPKQATTNRQTQKTTTPQVTIAELLKDEAPAKEGSIYYVRTVKPTDTQGIWGIIVDGLTENFAIGIAISRDETIDTYQVTIPRLSDDALPDNSSSFLGKLIDRKTRESFVYNFIEKKIGQNPDLIYPGQEILIINFEAEELIDIYTYFVENS